jgi:hypothetical protein
VEQKEAVSRQRRGKDVSAAATQLATIEELSELVFSMRPMPRLYSEDQREKFGCRRSEAAVSSLELPLPSNE